MSACSKICNVAILCIAFLTLLKMFSSAENTQSNSKFYVLTMICKLEKKAKSIFRLLILIYLDLLILFLSYYRSQVVLQVWHMQWQVGTKENFSSPHRWSLQQQNSALTSKVSVWWGCIQGWKSPFTSFLGSEHYSVGSCYTTFTCAFYQSQDVEKCFN